MFDNKSGLAENLTRQKFHIKLFNVSKYKFNPFEILSTEGTDRHFFFDVQSTKRVLYFITTLQIKSKLTAKFSRVSFPSLNAAIQCFKNIIFKTPSILIKIVFNITK